MGNHGFSECTAIFLSRRQIDGMSEFLPTWCLKSIIKSPYRRSFQSAYWVRTDLKKMKQIVNFLAYSVLQPTLKGAALQATHIMVTQEPGLLSINPALLQNRWTKQQKVQLCPYLGCNFGKTCRKILVFQLSFALW